MPEQMRSKDRVHAAGGVGEGVAAQTVEADVGDVHDDKANHQYFQRGQATMHQHLVDHHLEEQRRHEAHKLYEHRDKKHLGQNLLETLDYLPETVDAEAEG